MSRRKIQIIVAAIVAIIFGVIYFVFSPEASDNYFPTCPFRLVTGFECPGCGSQRAIHHLLHLDIKQAFIRNPLMVLMIPYILVGLYFEYFGGKEKYPKMRLILYGKKATIIAFIVIIIYWIGRNLI